MKISNSQHELRKLLEAYLLRVTALQLRCADFVVSKDVRRFVSEGGLLPLLIVVADNPGDNERDLSEFLSAHGNAGTIARCLLEAVFGAEFLEHVLILNKSNYSTSRTACLSKLLSKSNATTDAELVRQIRGDQEANGRLVRQLSILLRIPVVTLGWETDSKTFGAFRDGHGQLAGSVTFRGLTVQKSQIVPHTSFYRCYLPVRGNSERALAWNARLRAFLERHKDVAALSTASGGISEKTLREINDPELWQSYFATVILGASQSA